MNKATPWVPCIATGYVTRLNEEGYRETKPIAQVSTRSELYIQTIKCVVCGAAYPWTCQCCTLSKPDAADKHNALQQARDAVIAAAKAWADDAGMITTLHLRHAVAKLRELEAK